MSAAHCGRLCLCPADQGLSNLLLAEEGRAIKAGLGWASTALDGAVRAETGRVGQRGLTSRLNADVGRGEYPPAEDGRDCDGACT